jgi:hypothetical protein
MPQRPAQAVELPDDQGVAGSQLVQELIEGGPVGAGAAGGLGEHPIAAGGLKGVDLELGVLVGGGDAGIAKQMSHVRERRRTLGQRWLCDVDFGHGFWTPAGRAVAGEWRLSQKRSFLRQRTFSVAQSPDQLSRGPFPHQ